MKRQLYRHVDWLVNEWDIIGTDAVPMYESFIWITVELNPNLNTYHFTNDLDILKIMFLIGQLLQRLTLRSTIEMRELSSISDILSVIEHYTEDEIRENNCIKLRAYDLSFNSQPRKLIFCVTYELLYYYEYDVIKLYMLLTDDVNDIHYYAA